MAWIASLDVHQLQKECDELRRKLASQSVLECELETIKEELEKVLETHKTLQEVALAFEEKNRNLQKQYKTEVKERMRLDERRLDLENELETKLISYQNLEKRLQKMKEKLDESENLEELVYTLEKDKRKLQENIKDLEDELEVSQAGTENQQKELKNQIQKLTKENKKLNDRLEVYLDEMEELDQKCEQFKIENKELKQQYEQLKSIELVGTNAVEMQALEDSNKELEMKLQKESEKRETVENELFKVEEEYENYKMAEEESDKKIEAEIERAHNDLFGRKTSSSSESTNSENKNNMNDEVLRFLVKKKQKLLDNREKENDILAEKVKAYEQEHDVLLEENSSLAKSNMEMLENLKESQLNHDTNVAEIESQQEFFQNQQQQEDMAHLGIFKEYEDDKNAKDWDVVKLTGELGVMQEYLRLATDKNHDLQIELNEVKRDLFQKLNEQQQNLIYQHQHSKKMERAYSTSYVDRSVVNNGGETSSTSSLNSQESDKMLNVVHRKAIKQNEEEKEREYEHKIRHQSNVIRSLEERILSLREDYKRRIQRVTDNNNGTMSSPENTPPVAIKNGKLHDSMDEYTDNVFQRRKSMDYSEDDLDCNDSLTDRELRRISYRLADGSWKHIPSELNISRKEANQIINSSLSDQEKIYRLLVTWRSEADSTREELLKLLIERVGSKRKDIVKFLKEMMTGKQSKDGALKTKFQKFKKSVKRQ